MLVDLKDEKLTQQDLGQMQMYVNCFDRLQTEEELRAELRRAREEAERVLRLTATDAGFEKSER